jgi:hypothetical protein
MILSASESDSMRITKEHLQRAIDTVDALEPNMHKVFSGLGQTYDKERNISLEEIVKKQGNISKQTLFKLMRATYAMSWKEFEDRLNSAIAAGSLRSATVGDQLMIMNIEEGEKND